MKKSLLAALFWGIVVFAAAQNQTSMTVGSGGGSSVSATTCTNQFITAIAALTGAGTCTTATLASAQFANQGSTTTVLHGNAVGNPSWTGVDLVNDATANQGTVNQVLHGNAAGQPSFSAVSLLNDVTGNLGTGQLVNLGSGTATGTLTGLICKGSPNQATTGTSEQTLATCAIPANTLIAAGSAVKVTFLWIGLNNNNSKRFRIRIGGIGGTIVFDDGGTTTTSNNLGFPGTSTIWYVTSTTANAGGTQANPVKAGGAVTAIYGFGNAGLSITWTNPNDLVITGTTSGAAGDMTLQSYSVEVLR